MADLNIGWWRVSNSGADATIKRFMFFNRALTARDAAVLSISIPFLFRIFPF